jgi:hypothetical protein
VLVPAVRATPDCRVHPSRTRIDELQFRVAVRVAAFVVETGVLSLGLNEHFHWS